MPLQGNVSPITGEFKIDVTPYGPASPQGGVHDIPNNAPYNIIDKDNSYHVHVQLDLAGNLVALQGHNVTYTVLLESMGPGFEGKVGEKVNTFGPMVTPSFTDDVWISCGTPTSDGVGEGVYKLVVVATMETQTGVPLGIVGFDEGTFIQVYDDIAL